MYVHNTRSLTHHQLQPIWTLSPNRYCESLKEHTTQTQQNKQIKPALSYNVVNILSMEILK